MIHRPQNNRHPYPLTVKETAVGSGEWCVITRHGEVFDSKTYSRETAEDIARNANIACQAIAAFLLQQMTTRSLENVEQLRSAINFRKFPPQEE